MKINKIDAMAKNTKHVGLLLFAFVKFFLWFCVCVFFFFNFIPGKGGFSLDKGLGEGGKISPGLRARDEGLSSAPSLANFPRQHGLVGQQEGSPGAHSAFRHSFSPRLSVCPLGR